MTYKPDNPAFPCETSTTNYLGLTRMEVFTLGALQGLLINSMEFRQRYDGKAPWREAIAEEAVALATATLDALKKK